MMSIRIMGIDPSSTQVGIGIITLTPTLKISSIEALDITLTNEYSHHKVMERMYKLNRYFYSILRYYTPMLISMEYGFINRLRPGAYGPLSQARGIMERSIKEYMLEDNSVIYGGYPPSIIKRGIGAKGNVKKEPVLEALLEKDELVKHIDMKKLSNDAVDGIAIAYTTLLDIREQPLRLLLK